MLKKDEQNLLKSVTSVCVLGQVASLHVASVHPAVQVGTWRKQGGNPVSGVQHRGLQVGFPSSAFAGLCLMPTTGDALVGCSSQSSGPALVVAWLPDALAHGAKVELAYLAHICLRIETSNGRSLDLCFALLCFACVRRTD